MRRFFFACPSSERIFSQDESLIYFTRLIKTTDIKNKQKTETVKLKPA